MLAGEGGSLRQGWVGGRECGRWKQWPRRWDQCERGRDHGGVQFRGVGGRGGGRPDFAQAGGGDPSGIDKAVKAFFEAASSAFSA